jgi:hypothetical protein
MSLNGGLLKRREGKFSDKQSIAIENMKRSYRHLHFYSRLANNVKTQLENVILE